LIVPKFRKKPVVIEAMQFTGDNAEQIADFAYGANGAVSPRGVLIETLEGEMRANIGDWIIKGVKGEFYPCRNDIFEATYEPAES
jgi:hypothetical protein